jgi:prepilin-type processing-associated H-X9-DG protein
MVHGTGVPKVFFCPSTAQGHQLQLQNDPTTGDVWYPDLGLPAFNRLATIGHSYDTIPFFADMENYWNGNGDFKHNSRAMRKTLSSIGTYKHEHEAFGLTGQSAGPSRIWLYADTDCIISMRSFYPDPDNNHGDVGLNVAFCDGHVQWLKRREVVYSHELSQDNNRTRAYPRW